MRRSPERAPIHLVGRQVKSASLLVWMVLTICAVAALAYWDEQREFAAALADFAGEQHALAQAVALALRNPLVHSQSANARIGQASSGSTSEARMRLGAALKTAQFASAVKSVERPRQVQVLIRDPVGPGLTGSDGRVVRSPTIEGGFTSNASWVRLGRNEAGTLGLPARTAMAGLTTLDNGGEQWGVVVLATAERERDREVFAQWRLVLSVVVASGLVLAFGGLALRTQRKQMSLAHELEVASVQSKLDERLVRADKLATMGALATGIAHEVSTPLGVIVGRAEQVLSKLNGDERSKRAVEAIVQQAERISDIIRGFLALARGDSPRMARVDPATLGKVALDLVQHRFAKAGVHLTSFSDPDLPEIGCEPRLMEQVLVNLLLNACDACEPGGNVDLRVVAEEQRVAFVVTDDGSGISADAAARIIEPFFTTKAVGEGSGLGLAIANELVKHHRGSLSVAARQGHHGTRACVELPSTTEQKGA
jgi:two-component system, NtrC family, sensor kinase